MLDSSYNKTWISVIMGILIILDQTFGIKIGFLTEEYITMLLAVIWPILVLVIPNADAEQHTVARSR